MKQRIILAMTFVLAATLFIAIATAQFAPQHITNCTVDEPFQCQIAITDAGMNIELVGNGATDVRATVIGPCGPQQAFDKGSSVEVEYVCDLAPSTRSELSVLYDQNGERRVASGIIQVR